MISWKTTLIFGIIAGALIGGLCGGISSLTAWFALVLTFGAVAVANVTMVDTAVSAAVGAGLGAVAGLAAAIVARAAGANRRNVLRCSTDGSLPSGVSAGAGVTLSAYLAPVYAVGIAAVLAPTSLFFLEVKDAFTYIFQHRSVPFLIALTRILLGLCLGSIFGFLSAGLIALAVMVVVPWVATPDAIADLVLIVGLTIGPCSGGIVAINRLMSGSDMRGVVCFAIKGSTVAGVAAAFGIILSWVGLKIPGIVVAIGAATLWNVTHGRHTEQS